MILTDYEKIKADLSGKDFLIIHGLCKNTNGYKVYVSQNGANEGVVYYRAKTRSVAVVTHSLEFIRALCDFLPKKRTHFMGVNGFVYDYLCSRYTMSYSNRCGYYVYNGKPYDYQYTVAMGELKKEYWKLVSDGTFYRASKEEICEAIDNRPNCCIYVDGKPVCWCLLHTENSLGMLYTLPEYRHRGYALEVMTALCEKILKVGITPYAYIVKGNVASEELAVKYNLEYLYDAYYCQTLLEKY